MAHDDVDVATMAQLDTIGGQCTFEPFAEGRVHSAKPQHVGTQEFTYCELHVHIQVARVRHTCERGTTDAFQYDVTSRVALF